MSTDEELRDRVATEPQVLDTWELTGEEKQLLTEEATQDVSGFAIGGGSVMGAWAAGPSCRLASPRDSARL